MEEVTVTLRAAPVDCWSCGCEYRIISSILIAAGGEERCCSVADFTDVPDLLHGVIASVEVPGTLGPVKLRASATMGRTYLSNGCYHCDALFGQTHEVHARYAEVDLAPSPQPADEIWRAFLRSLPA